MDYDKFVKENEIKNEVYLKNFKSYLMYQRLSMKTIDKHVSNMDFYLNDFLTRYEMQSPEDGITRISEFLGYFFIRKCMWSSVSKIKEYITSLKKFYLQLCELDLVTNEQYNEMLYVIKVCKDDWINEYYDYYQEEYDDFF